MTIAVVNDTQPAISFEAGDGSLPVTATGPGPLSDAALSAILSAAGGADAVKWFSDGYLEAEYTFYTIQTTFQRDLGLQVAPATASRPAGEVDINLITRVRRPITFKIVSWMAQRMYVKPLCPHWNTGSTNEKLLDQIISATNPLQSLNHKTWEVSGRYIYAFKKEPFITVNQVEYFVLPAGKTTAENSKLPVALHAYTQADFSFVPLDASWIPITTPLGTPLPVGYNSRTGLPDNVPRQGLPVGPS